MENHIIPPTERVEVSWPVLILGIVIVVALAAYVVIHLSEAETFVALASQMKPWWLLAALFLQSGTYLCSGLIWNLMITTGGYQIAPKTLARLAIEKLSIDQLVPVGGISGNIIVFKTMRRLGLPEWLALDSLFTGTLSYYSTYSLLAFGTVWFLLRSYNLNSVLTYVIGAFAVFLLSIPLIMLWLLVTKNQRLPNWLSRFSSLRRLFELRPQLSAKRIFAAKTFVLAMLFQLVTFCLDAGTLWILMIAIGTPISFGICFVAWIIGSIAGTVSLLPGGLGGFEAGMVAALTLLGTPVEIALTATLLLRGFTLWLPLILGAIFARKDLSWGW